MSTLGKHNDRVAETPNADEDIQNIILVGEKEKTYVQYFEERTKDIKVRKNNVLGIECFMGVSPETEFIRTRNIKDLKSWANDSIKWIKKEFGEDNLVKAHLHIDELTPHIHAFIIPLKDKKLNAKHYIGGTKYRLTDLQTSYHNAVKHYNLERGIEGSKAKHQDVKRFYSAVNKTKEIELPEPKTFESKNKYYQRIKEIYKDVLIDNANKDIEIEKLRNQIPRRISIRKLMKKTKKKEIELENTKILRYIEKNPQIRKYIMQVMEEEIKTNRKKIVNKSLEQIR